MDTLREIGRIKREHAHLMLHLPRKHSRTMHVRRYGKLREEVLAFLRETGGFTDNGVLSGKDRYGMLTPRMRWCQACYLLEGLDPELRNADSPGGETLPTFLGIRLEKDLSPLDIKRAGTLQSLSHAARQKVGFSEVTDVLELAEHLAIGATPRNVPWPSASGALLPLKLAHGAACAAMPLAA